jgi:NADPH:quinone reductase-like Zn-dependent oxidoreductase
VKLRHKIACAALLLVGATFLASLLALSYEAPCRAAPPLPGGAASMKAAVHRCYGSPDVIAFEDVRKPSPADDEVLVKVRAAAVNPVDWHYLRGEPYVMRLSSGLGLPNKVRLGVDFAGTVDAVGRNVTRFKPGDAVFGGGGGTLAEYVTVRADRAIVHKPPNLTFEQAAAVPVAAITALQGLRDKGRIRAGQKILINGASGGVGTFAVQIAKSYGAEVTGVCSTRNLAMVRAIGADRVVDYTREDFTQGSERYDLILDMVGNHALSDVRRVLKPDGVYVMVGAPSDGRFLGPLTSMLKVAVYAPFVSQEFGGVLATLAPPDLEVVSDLMRSGKVTPVIDRAYPLSAAADAIRYLEEGHARGKVVVTLDEMIMTTSSATIEGK